MPRILVTYATRAGSTREVADFIADVIRSEGLGADLKEVNEVQNFTGYNGVILGTAIRVGKVMPEAIKFLKKHTETFEKLPIAYFLVCLSAKDQTEEATKAIHKYLESLRVLHKPVAEAAFAGMFDRSRLRGLAGFIMRRSKESPIPEGDWRDWDAMKTWTLATLPKLLTPQPIMA